MVKVGRYTMHRHDDPFGLNPAFEFPPLTDTDDLRTAKFRISRSWGKGAIIKDNGKIILVRRKNTKGKYQWFEI